MRTIFKASDSSACCLWLLGTALFMTGCAGSKTFKPDQKFGPDKLRADYTIFRNVLEENHPSLYWYTTKDSLDHYFDLGFSQIRDSMTEMRFRTILNYSISKINCGHTTVNYSRELKKHLDTSELRQFPLSLKLWEDTAVVYATLLRNDTVLKRGTIIKGINGRPVSYYRDSIFQFLSTDGYNISHKYQTLSNRGAFGTWYKNIFGLPDSLTINYLDPSLSERVVTIGIFDPKKDTTLKKISYPKLTTKDKRELRIRSANNLMIDTAGRTAVLTMSTFVSGHGIRRFIRRSFRKLKKQDIKNLVIDVRNNGGGEVNNSTLLTKFLADKRFKLADSLYAINKRSRYGKYIKHNYRNRVFMTFISRKKRDGRYHFGYFENRYFKPKKHYHFNGQVYVITGANSFSATTLFVNAIKGTPNIKIIGEETGGGSYGNTAWLIPDVTLPNTKIRFRLPIFRLVENVNYPKTGRGVYPDIEVKPSVEDIKRGSDVKMDYVRRLIYGDKVSSH